MLEVHRITWKRAPEEGGGCVSFEFEKLEGAVVDKNTMEG